MRGWEFIGKNASCITFQIDKIFYENVNTLTKY